MKKGYSEELWFKKLIEKAGGVAVRSPASKGAFDIMAVLNGHVRFFQVKATKKDVYYLNNMAREEWKELSKSVGGYFAVIFKRGKGKRRIVRLVKAEGEPPKKIRIDDGVAWEEVVKFTQKALVGNEG